MSTQNRKPPLGSPKGQKDREIARLRRELTAERRRTAALERELATLKRELQAGSPAATDQPLRRLKQRAGGIHREERLLDAANRRAGRYRNNSFLRYLWESVRESIPVQVMAKLVLYLRRVRLVQTLFTILLALAAVVTVAVVSATILPLLFFGTAFLTMLAYLRSRRMNRILRRELTDRRIRVLVPPRGPALDRGSFFIRNAHAMAAEGNVTVIVVTPYTVSSRGAGGQGGFFTARKEAEGLYLVRRHYFFVLRRKVLDGLDGDVTIVY